MPKYNVIDTRNFNLFDQQILHILTSNKDLTRVLEVALPMHETNHSFSAAQSAISTFSKLNGVDGNFGAFDVFVMNLLPLEALIKIHEEGEESYLNLPTSSN